jgi:hypothetical protein
VRAEGDGRVERVVHAEVDSAWRPISGSEQTVAADTLCLGYGFVPSAELLRLAGCDFAYDEDLGGSTVIRDAWLRTSVTGVSAAGDGAGVTGSYAAIAEGQVAALGAAADLGALTSDEAGRRARPPRKQLARSEALRRALRPLHAVGTGIYELAAPDTVVCRCERWMPVSSERVIGTSLTSTRRLS